MLPRAAGSSKISNSMAQTPSYAPCLPFAPYFLNIFTPLSHLYIADTGSSYQHFCPFVQEFAPRRPA
jgi:hypothetical protein